MGSVSWLIALLLVLITKLAYARAHGMDFNAELGFSSGFRLWGSDEDEELEAHSASEYPAWRSRRAKKMPVNVDSFGTVGDGIADDTLVIIISPPKDDFHPGLCECMGEGVFFEECSLFGAATARL